MSTVIEMSSRLTGKRLLEVYAAFCTLDLEYYEQREARVIPDKALVTARRAAADELVKWTHEYGASVGVTFDWPHQAVTHAKEVRGA